MENSGMSSAVVLFVWPIPEHTVSVLSEAEDPPLQLRYMMLALWYLIDLF